VRGARDFLVVDRLVVNVVAGIAKHGRDRDEREATGLPARRRLEARHDAGIPLTDLELQERRLAAKFEALVQPVLGSQRAARLRELVLHLDELEDTAALLRAAAA
jgi:hypothetical protein